MTISEIILRSPGLANSDVNNAQGLEDFFKEIEFIKGIEDREEDKIALALAAGFAMGSQTLEYGIPEIIIKCGSTLVTVARNMA